MYKLLYTTKDKTKSNELVNVIDNGIQDLNKEIQVMSEQRKGLKFLTPNQMLSRLPITLAQLEAGNNSEKLKNEIIQLLYSLYRSKNMTKQV